MVGVIDMKYILVVLVVFFLCSMFVSCVHRRTRHLSHAIASAQRNGEPIPLVSLVVQGVSIDEAYTIQKHYVSKWRKKEAISGFKAGLTSVSMQQKFGVAEPVSGVLFASGQRNPSAQIHIEEYQQLMIEMEIGFVMKEALTQPVPDKVSLRDRVNFVVPVIELPDLGFQDVKMLTAKSIIAANVGSRQYIVGAHHATNIMDSNGIHAMLYCDGERVGEGESTDAMGDPWDALLWLVNTVIAQGYTIVQGQVLITGAMGPMLPGKTGVYTADYGPLGTLSFTVVE